MVIDAPNPLSKIPIVDSERHLLADVSISDLKKYILSRFSHEKPRMSVSTRYKLDGIMTKLVDIPQKIDLSTYYRLHNIDTDLPISGEDEGVTEFWALSIDLNSRALV